MRPSPPSIAACSLVLALTLASVPVLATPPGSQQAYWTIIRRADGSRGLAERGAEGPLIDAWRARKVRP